MGDFDRIISMYKGEAKPVAYQWYTDDAMSIPKDLTGATFRAAIKIVLAAAEYTIIKKDEAFNKANIAQGQVVFTLSKEDTLIAPFADELECYLQVEASLPDGSIDKTFIDTLQLKGTVFHD